MVFTTAIALVRSRGPDEFWRKRKIFKLAAHVFGRPRNCYSNTIRAVHRSLVHATKGRELKRADLAELWTQRISAGCEAHGLDYSNFNKNLVKNNILLNRKTLSDLAIWEPRTFESLCKIAENTPEDLPLKQK